MRELLFAHGSAWFGAEHRSGYSPLAVISQRQAAARTEKRSALPVRDISRNPARRNAGTVAPDFACAQSGQLRDDRSL